MKRVMLFATLWAAVACSSHDPIGTTPDLSDTLSLQGKAKIMLRTYEGVTSPTGLLYMYRNGTLYDTKEATAAQVLEVSLPLDEAAQVMAIANGSNCVSQESSVTTLRVTTGVGYGNEIFVAEPVAFRTGESSNVEMILNRKVGRINFVPTDDSQAIAANTDFDSIVVTVRNASYALLPGNGGQVEVGDITFGVGAATGFKGSVYLFPNAGERSTLYLRYLLQGSPVQETDVAFESDYKFSVAASVNTNILIPILNNGYTQVATLAVGTQRSPVRYAIQYTPF